MSYRYTPMFKCKLCGHKMRCETVEAKTKKEIEEIISGETCPAPPRDLHQCSQNKGRTQYGQMEFAGIIVPTEDLLKDRKP